MTLVPVLPLSLPSDLAGQSNGKLGSCQLAVVHFPGLGDANLHHLVARGYNAFNMAFHGEASTGRFGSVNSLTTTGGGAYRSLALQEGEFFKRYSPTYNPLATKLTNQRVYLGKRYFLRFGFSACAAPGTSPHGWGCAIDLALFSPVTHAVSSLAGNAAAYEWAKVNAPSFGFGWEAHEGSPEFESWHVDWTYGDAVPRSVLDLEAWLAAVA